ncbi:fatty-acyl-CoA synthase [Paenibacillus intestini]|nr:fatty-acyl-CoA synthase [Paenibacillus intestini]
MLNVNNEEFLFQDLQRQMDLLGNNPALCSPQGKRIAVCLRHPFEILAILLFVMERGGGILLLHADTPLSKAKEIAELGGCGGIVYSNLNDVIPLRGMALETEPTIYQMTSGTTGEPKVISRSWIEVQEEITAYNEMHDWRADETPVVLVPIHHSFGLISGMLSALARGTKPPILITNSNPKYIIHKIKETKNSIVFGVPSLFSLLLSFSKESMRFHKVVSAGAYIPQKTFMLLKASTQELWHQYGCSELGCISIGVNQTENCNVGKILNTMRVETRLVEACTDEEILVHRKDKVIYTGDAGFLTKDGFLQVKGRIDDVINVSGYMVNPSEIEDTILQMENVREVVVFGKKHVVFGESIKALVVAENVSNLSIRAWCNVKLPKYKVPGSIEIVDKIPRTENGKISRKILREMDGITNDKR